MSAQPLAGLVGTYGKEWYVDVPAAAPIMRIVMISPSLTFPDGVWQYTVGSPHYNWTAAAIDGAHAAGIPWVVVGMHKPCLTLIPQNCSSGPDLMNLLVEKHVDLVMQGHVHMYERTKQLEHSPSCPTIQPNTSSAACIADSDNTLAQGGTVFATMGTGGDEPQHPKLPDPEQNYFAAHSSVSAASWGYLDVTADSDQLSASFHETSGAALSDSFTISRTTSADHSFVDAAHGPPGSVKVQKVTVPAAARAGDTMLLVFTCASSITWSGPAGVTGWTQLGTFDNAGTTSTVWTKTVASGDPGAAVQLTSSTFSKGALELAVYSGSLAVRRYSRIAATRRARRTSRRRSLHRPAAQSSRSGRTSLQRRRRGPRRVVLRCGIPRSDQAAGRYSALLADSAPGVAGTYGGPTATTDARSSQADMWTVALP